MTSLFDTKGSAASSCRVSNNLGPKGNWTKISPGCGGPSDNDMYELNTFTYSGQNKGAVYTQHGLIMRGPDATSVSMARAPESHLKVYQRRPFLTSEYWNTGCAPLYCSNGNDVYPTGRPACTGGYQTSSWSDQAMNPYFASVDPFYANAVPTNAVCYKGTSPNSTAGWVFVNPAGGGSAVPLWSVNGGNA
jgi:hypothetical protein